MRAIRRGVDFILFIGDELPRLLELANRRFTGTSLVASADVEDFPPGSSQQDIKVNLYYRGTRGCSDQGMDCSKMRGGIPVRGAYLEPQAIYHLRDKQPEERIETATPRSRVEFKTSACPYPAKG